MDVINNDQALVVNTYQPTAVTGEPMHILEALTHDKKADGQDISVVYVPEVGSFTFKKLPLSELARQIEREMHE